MGNDRHTLPLDIIRYILLDAIDGDRATAAILSRMCKTVNLWIVPVLYSTVIVTISDLKSFERTLLASKDRAEPVGKHNATHLLKRPLGAYVRHLWIGSKGTHHTSRPPWRTIDPVEHAEEASSMVLKATITIVSLCPNLRALAIAHYPSSIMRQLVPCIAETLESLSFCPGTGHLTSLDLADMSHCHSLRDVTFLQTELTDGTLSRLLRMPSVQHITCIYNNVPHTIGLLPALRPVQRDRLKRSFQAAMAQLHLVGECASPAFRRMKVIYLSCDNSTVREINELQRFMGVHGPPGPRDKRIVLSAIDGRNNLDRFVSFKGYGGPYTINYVNDTKYWLDEWIASLDPAWPGRGCVPHTVTQ
ncbi:uncharacterized protein C8Q71DRAFT_774792 [Rhodofomes roseus]|uniref:Uncharacterized protein n=1 Tax=Rhodofomes roseus TaxID=34475 RepID=A0A4Y9YQ11_9APHY|nr:uncharacterized protein C8Q71DRAFT_774792 [Rhodofomes roseus]KAH9833255.1 hypothetical protein C8Q71DRAFT_774792 [Rhodofomes roseus]TFY64514.1 hypothetical protein EVJ58_g2577 [Rhodofomes roseus]